MMIFYYSFLLLLITLGSSEAEGALPNDDVTCPIISDVSCPAISLSGSDDVIQLVPKRMSDADQVIGNLPEMEGVELKLVCAEPDCLSNPCLNGGTCTETYDGYQCTCEGCHTGINCQDMFLKDCQEIYQTGQTNNGVYKICPSSETEDQEVMDVYCNLDGVSNGWTVLQSRHDGTVDFYRDWADYKNGFGDLGTEFWLGNDNIHRITNQKPYLLRIAMVDIHGESFKSLYDNFHVTNESDGYRLSVQFRGGGGGDALSYHNGQQFSTRDRDNDAATGNCAITYEGAWWYNECFYSNLNGRWSYSEIYPDHTGISWDVGGVWRSVRVSKMEIRPM